MASSSDSGSGHEARAVSDAEAKKKKKHKKITTPIPQVTYPGGGFTYYDDAGALITRYLDDEEIVLIAELLDQRV